MRSVRATSWVLGRHSQPAVAIYTPCSVARHAEVRDFTSGYNRVVDPFCDVQYSCDSVAAVCSFEPVHLPNPNEDMHRFAVEVSVSAHRTTIEPNGRKVHPAFLFEVKKQSESKEPWDYFKLVETVPANE
jgi:hypothetical protein